MGPVARKPIFWVSVHLGLVVRKPIFGVSEHVRPKPTYLATETSVNIESSYYLQSVKFSLIHSMNQAKLYALQRVDYKGADQTAKMRRLVGAFVFRM